MRTRWILFAALMLLWAMPWSVHAMSISCGQGPAGPCATSSIQGPGRVTSQTVSAANTAVAVTIAAVQGVRGHVYHVEARCSAGTSSLTITDGGTTVWSTAAAEVGVVNYVRDWSHGLTGASNSAVVITLAACGAANTGTLMVQADQW